MYFCLFIIISPWKKKARSLIEINLDLLNLSKDALSQDSVKIGLVVLYRKRILNFAISVLPPLERRHGPSFEKLKPLSPKDTLCLVWLKLAQWFFRGNFLHLFSVLSLFRYYLLLEKVWPFLCLNLNSVHPKMLRAKFGWNWTSCSRGKLLNCGNVLRLFC